MARFVPAALAALICLALAAPVRAQAAKDLVVTDVWMAQHLHDSGLVLIQVGDQATYNNGHIPGARFTDGMDLHTMTGPQGLSLEMPTAAELHDALERLGISDASHVVVYASDEYWSPATRVLLTLDYAGLGHVSYLDAGLRGWIDGGHPVSRDVPLPRKGTLAPLTLRPVVVDAEFVKAHQHTPGFAIVDARATEFYTGSKESGPRDHRLKGHIPGAVSAPFDDFATHDGQLKSAAEIEALLTKAGVKPGDTVVAYCHVGQQATATLFAARLVGHPAVLYDGSFEDWARRGLPVEIAKQDKH